MTVKRYTALSAAAVILLLAACGKKEQPQPEDLACQRAGADVRQKRHARICRCG